MCMCVADQYSEQLLKENRRMRDGRRDTGHRQTVSDKMEESQSRRVREKTLSGGEDTERE